MDTKYLSAAETAALIRTQFKKFFPETKFYVRSHTYSGGASIDIDYIDGPALADVKKIVEPFNGAEFDGMEDLKIYNRSWLLPDGSATFEKYEKQNGVEYRYTQPHPGAVLVSFGADFIFTERYYTPAALHSIAEPMREKYSLEPLNYCDTSLWVNHKSQIEGLASVNFNGDNWLYWREREWFRSELYAALDSADLRTASNTPQPTAPMSETCKSEELEISFDRDWTWIKFTSKPSEATRELLKTVLHARWSNKRNAWYVMEPVAEDEIRVQLATAF